MKGSILFGSSIIIIGILISAVSFINKKMKSPGIIWKWYYVIEDISFCLQLKILHTRCCRLRKIAENEYQVSFENAFTFQPDVLVNTIQRLLANDPLARDYVVNVLNCANVGHCRR